MPQPPSDIATALAELQDWYAAQCNGDWEHSFGVVIETLDNPGWSVVIDLDETPLACRARPPLKQHVSEQDWLDVQISDAKFVAAGDPMKLLQILTAFDEFKRSAEGEGYVE